MPSVIDSEEFARLVDPYRRELLTHCYRMLGSLHDAEDLVQDTYLRAWRSYGTFEGRSSLRTWLYRIATKRCLTALERRGRRALPVGLGPSADPSEPLAPVGSDITWLQPFPDQDPADPAAVVAGRSGLRLAFIAALQYLAPRQRAVLILRDVLGWRAAEVAALLDTTTAAVNSALQRARAQLAATSPTEEDVAEPDDPARRAHLDRYVAAFENGDVTTLVSLMSRDVVWDMPPNVEWYAGRADVAVFLSSRVFATPARWKLVHTTANGQPALAIHHNGEPHAIQVLSLSAHGVDRVTTFLDPTLLAHFGGAR